MFELGEHYVISEVYTPRYKVITWDRLDKQFIVMFELCEQYVLSEVYTPRYKVITLSLQM